MHCGARCAPGVGKPSPPFVREPEEQAPRPSNQKALGALFYCLWTARLGSSDDRLLNGTQLSFEVSIPEHESYR